MVIITVLALVKILSKLCLGMKKQLSKIFVSAQYNLAVMYRRGEGAKVDNKAAFHWYEQAAQLGYGLAQLNLSKAL